MSCSIIRLANTTAIGFIAISYELTSVSLFPLKPLHSPNENTEIVNTIVFFINFMQFIETKVSVKFRQRLL